MPQPLPHEAHVLSRATFGWSPALETELLSVGWVDWLDQQLDPDTIPDPAVDAMLAGYDSLSASNAQNHGFAVSADDGEEILTGQLHHSALLRACYSRRQLNEVMVRFWADHFNVWLGDHWLRHFAIVDHREVARSDPFGRFADLLSASAHSPAMLVYLDNYISDANDPAGVNENYGRELLELHTMGLLDGVQPFAEADMVGVAKVLSGWSVDTKPTAQVFAYKPWRHHTGPVSLFGGTWSTPGRTGTAGYDDGASLLDHLAHHPATAHHLAFKLCRRFVRDDPPPALVAGAADVYLANDTAIGPVIRHIFHSPEFAAGPGAKVRRGFEIFVAYVRALDVQIDADPMGDASHGLHGDGWGWLSKLDGRSFSHPAPDGPADTAPDWVSSDGMLRRWAAAGAITEGWADGIDVDLAALVRPVPPTVGQWITQVAGRVLGRIAADPPHPFTDVPAWVEDSVRWITAEGHASGYRDNTYRPDDNITRAAVTRMLHRIAGSPDTTALPHHGLTDVPAWVDDAVTWITANGYATGYRDNTYRPDDNITRAAVTRMLHRIHGEVIDPLTPDERAAALELFSDVPAGADDPAPSWLVDWKAHDLVTLLLATPAFQRR